MNKYLYITEDRDLILIMAKIKPSLETRPERGSWIIREWSGEKWIMPCFAEITWGTLSKMNFIGKLMGRLYEKTNTQTAVTNY